MAIAFVGHGGRNVGDDIRVPPGVTINFFVDFNLDMSPINVEQLLSTGDYGRPNQTYVPGTGATPNMVPNYVLDPLTSEELQRDLSAARSLAGVVWTEAETALCTTTDVCQTLPAHTCSGLLGQAARAGETEINYLACRGRIGSDDKMSTRLGAPGTDESVRPELIEWMNDFLARAKTDPAAAGEEFDALPQATQAMLLNLRGMQQWSAERERTSPSEPAAVLEARRFIESHGDVAFADWADQWDETQWRVAMADSEIAAAYGRGDELRKSDRERLLGSEAGATGDELAVAVASAQEQCRALATAVSQLTGTESDADPVAGIGQAFGTMMEQVTVVQRLAEARGRNDVLSAAIGTYDTGANVGQELAMYTEGEGPDAEKLGTLTTAVGTLNDWAASIPAA